MFALVAAVTIGVAVSVVLVSSTLLARPYIGRLVSSLESGSGSAIHDLVLRNVTAREITFWVVAGAILLAVVGYLLSKSLMVALVMSAITVFVPQVVFGYLRRVRLQEFDERLPASLDQLASATKAGMSLAQAIEDVARTAPSPVAEELSQVAAENETGVELGAALVNARERIGSAQFGLVVSSLLVNIEKGGNLPEALQTISASLKEVWRLEQKLLTASAEGRKAMLLISGVPVFVLVLVVTLQPELMQPLTSTLAGNGILVLAFIFYFGGLAWLRRILNTGV